MRSISSTLKAAQEATSVTPYVRVVIGGVDYSGRILQLEHHEEPYRDRATLVLRNDDRALDDVDLRGEYFEIGYGCVTGSGNEYSNAPGLWVKSQQFTSAEGTLVCRLGCEGMWMLLREMHVMITGNPPAYDIPYDRTHTVYQLIGLVLADVDFTLEALGTQDDGIINTFKPLFDINEIPYEIAALVLYRLIQMTNCYLRMKAGKVVKVVYPHEDDAVDETFYSDQAHWFFEYTEKKNLVVPNSVVVFCNQGDDGSWDNIITGTAKNEESITMYGREILNCFQASAINNQADADNRANAILNRIESEELSGRLIIPHDCSMELYDRVAIYDVRGT